MTRSLVYFVYLVFANDFLSGRVRPGGEQRQARTANETDDHAQLGAWPCRRRQPPMRANTADIRLPCVAISSASRHVQTGLCHVPATTWPQRRLDALQPPSPRPSLVPSVQRSGPVGDGGDRIHPARSSIGAARERSRPSPSCRCGAASGQRAQHDAPRHRRFAAAVKARLAVLAQARPAARADPLLRASVRSKSRRIGGPLGNGAPPARPARARTRAGAR